MKVVISGYGKMGHMVEQVLLAKGIEYIATEDVLSLKEELTKDAVCIDFTTPDAFRNNYKSLASKFKAVVIGTTGWNDIADDVIEAFRSRSTSMVWASNFSIGVNVLFAATELISRKLGEAGSYSPYIVETHHIHKLDAPSGTARSLAELVDKGMMGKESASVGVINPAVDIQSIRCGEIAGIHTVGFEGVNDRITISHEAFSRAGFAQGAVLAAEKINQLEGIYEFRELLGI